MKPRFSIIIPTFNRAHLLPNAIQSVLAQTFSDFELVISNGGSTDDTSQVVRSYDDPRIMYVESSHRLTAGDNYQQGLDASKGEYITFLSDDDAYVPHLLETISELFEKYRTQMVGYPYARYYHEDLIDFERPIRSRSLLIPNFDCSVHVFSGEDALNEVLVSANLKHGQMNPRFVFPYLSNATYHHTIIQRLKARTARLFDTVPADLYMATAVFHVADSYACVDSPLLVWSSWAENATAAAQRNPGGYREHYEKLLNGRTLEFTPLKFASGYNCGANTIIQAMNDFSIGETNIDWSQYYKTTYENFMYLRSVGVDITDELEEFRQTLSLEPTELQTLIANHINKPGFRIKSALNIYAPKLATMLRQILRVNHRKSAFVIREGVENILEATRSIKPCPLV